MTPLTLLTGKLAVEERPNGLSSNCFGNFDVVVLYSMAERRCLQPRLHNAYDIFRRT
jgi:hypothetical protein